MNISQPNCLFHVGGGGSEGNILRQHFNQKDHRSCPSVLLFHASVLRWQNNSLSWDNAFHFCRIFPSRVKDRLCSWGEARTCQLLMLQGRSPKMMIFHGESNISIPIELMDVLLSLMYFLSLAGNSFLWVYKEVLSHQDLSLFKETAASQSSCGSLPWHLWVSELQWKGMGGFSNLFLKSYLWGSHKWWWMYMEQRIKEQALLKAIFGPFGDAYVCI